MTLGQNTKKRGVGKKIFYIAVEPSMILPDEPDQAHQGFEYDQAEACLTA